MGKSLDVAKIKLTFNPLRMCDYITMSIIDSIYCYTHVFSSDKTDFLITITRLKGVYSRSCRYVHMEYSNFDIATHICM